MLFDLPSKPKTGVFNLIITQNNRINEKINFSHYHTIAVFGDDGTISPQKFES